MGEIMLPAPVKPIVGLLSRAPICLDAARRELTALCGPIDLETEIRPFEHTAYYERAMGNQLQRQFLAFERLVEPEAIVDAKCAGNRIEADFASRFSEVAERPVNIDPGYVDLGKLVLATTKDRAHRIHLRDGIFAEVTLTFEAGSWRTLPWTYPDYRADTAHAFFLRVRERLKQQRVRVPGHSGSAPPVRGEE